MTIQLLGPIAVLILICGLAFLLIKWPQGRHKTFSQHVAVRRFTTYYYVGLFAVTLPLLFVFFSQWFVPTFQLSEWFMACVTVSLVAQFACTLIPEVGGWKTKYHRMFAGLSAALFLPCMIFLLLADSIAVIDKTIVSLGLMVMLGIIGWLFVAKDSTRNSLLLQIVYYTAFLGSIMVVSF